MTTYKIIDNLGLGTLAWTNTSPATKAEITRSLRSYHETHASCLPTNKAILIPSFGAKPNLNTLLEIYDLELKRA